MIVDYLKRVYQVICVSSILGLKYTGSQVILGLKYTESQVYWTRNIFAPCYQVNFLNFTIDGNLKRVYQVYWASSTLQALSIKYPFLNP